MASLPGAIVIIYLLLVNILCSGANLSVNYTVYEVTAFNSRERSILYSMQVQDKNVVFLNGVTNEAAAPMTVIVKENHAGEFEMVLQVNDVEYIKINKDTVLKQFKGLAGTYNMHRNFVYTKTPTLDKQFLDYILIKIWVDNCLKKNANNVQKIVIGKTSEKREIFVLKISTGVQKPAIFLMGGEQGSDWTSPAVILNFMNMALMNQMDDLINIYDVYLMPLYNPDGYQYSLKHDRFWNKNRNEFYPHIMCSSNDFAVGVNVDRNFFLTTSTYMPYSECDSIYTGHKTITEDESKSLARFLNTIASRMMAFINVRGFGNLITVPYAAHNQHANNYPILIEMLLHASDKVYAKYNVSYTLCNTGSCLYNHSGNSPDWVKSKMNVPIVYTIYMSDKQTFLPHIEQVATLTQHFTIIVRETLLLAHSIYGPLFNSARKVSSLMTIVSVFLVIINI